MAPLKKSFIRCGSMFIILLVLLRQQPRMDDYSNTKYLASSTTDSKSCHHDSSLLTRPHENTTTTPLMNEVIQIFKQNPNEVLGYQMPLLANFSFDNSFESISDRTIPGFTPNLVNQAFRNKRIVFMGDSTSRTLFVALKELLLFNDNYHDGEYTEESFEAFITQMNPTFAPAKADFKATNTCTPLEPYRDDTTLLQMINIERYLTNHSYFLREVPSLLQSSDVVIFNLGMHLLHLLPHRKLKSPKRYNAWIQYPNVVEELLHLIGSQKKKQLVLAKTTNRICHNLYMGKWGNMVKLFANASRIDEQTENLQDCLQFVKEELPLPQSQFHQLQKDFCEHGQITSQGAHYLNARLANTIEQYQKANIQVLPEYDLQTCHHVNPAPDGRHYKRMVLTRLHLLALMITEFFDNDTKEC